MRRCLSGAALLGLASCISSAPPPRTPTAPPSEALWSLPSAEHGSQHLIRVRYSGAEGSGTLRLVLRVESPQQFQLQASDALGRALWSLGYLHDGVWLVDHRRRTLCEGEARLTIAEVTLAPFELEALPNLLLGRLPVAPARMRRQSGDSLDFLDAAGRRWTVRLSANRPVAWTLWESRSPIIWWTEQDKGGILSHREGSQFRWRRVVSEPSQGTLQPPELSEGYRRIPCRESDLPQFRQGQSPPPGDGSSP